MAEELQKSLSEIVDKVSGAIEKATAEHGQQAVDLALEVGRIAAITDLVTGVAILTVAGVPLAAAIKLRKAWRACERHDPFPLDLMTFISGALALFTGVFGFEYLLKVHAWVGMFRPEVYLAYRAIF